MASITELPLPTSGKVNKICHISDIHIRAGTDNNDPKLTRFEEYIRVIGRISKWLERKHGGDGDIIIIITGDLVHDNKKAGAPCIELFYEIMNRLAKIAPVYIIRGNHDYNQASVSTQDMLTSLMHGMKAWTNVRYLKDTGHYIAGNVGFGLVAIQDALKSGDTHGRVEELPEFPKADALAGVEKRIALFHGDVPGVYPLEWIGEGWDYILLGDLHRTQVYGGKPASDKILMKDCGDGVFMMNRYGRSKAGEPIWGYPGSTVQQNFGESMTGHGFFMWDLAEDSVTSYHVHNDYGFVNARLREDGKWDVNMSYPTNEKNVDCWLDADKALGFPWFPKTWRMRIRQKNTLSMVDLHKAMAEKGVDLENVRTCWDDKNGAGGEGGEGDGGVESQTLDLKSFNDPNAWCEYISQQVTSGGGAENLVDGWQSLVKQPDLLKIKEDGDGLGDEVRDRNAKIAKAIDEYRKASELNATAIHGHTRFMLNYMDWSWVLCYKEGCWINFKDLNGQVHCVGGKNGWGKTSFLECICLALYGEGFPSRSSKSHSASVINVQKPAKTRAYTSVVFEIDQAKYKIKRTFDVQSKDKDKLNAKDITLEVLNDGGVEKWDLIHSGKTATGDWVRKNLGDVDTFLTSVMISQGFDGDFFGMDGAEQKKYLDKQLRLDSSTTFLEVLKTAYQAYEHLAKKLWTVLEAKKKDVAGYTGGDGSGYDRSGYDAMVCRIEQLESDIAEKEEVVKGLKDKWSGVSECLLTKGRGVLEGELKDVERELEGVGVGEGEDLTVLTEQRGGLKQSHDALYGKVNEELLEEDVDLEASLADLIENKPGDGRPDDGTTLEGVRKVYNDVVGKLSECGDIATFQKRLDEMRERIACMKNDVDEKRRVVGDIQGKLNEMGARMNQGGAEVIAFSDKDYKVWLKAYEAKVKEYGSLEKATEMIDEAKGVADGMEKTLADLKNELLEMKTKRNMLGFEPIKVSAKYGSLDIGILTNIHGKWRGMWGELVHARALLEEKAKRLVAEDNHGYNDACECCLARMQEKAGLKLDHGELEKRIVVLEHEMEKEFGGCVVDSEDAYLEACGVLVSSWDKMIVAKEKEAVGVQKKLEVAMKHSDTLENGVKEYASLENAKDEQQRAKGLREERAVWVAEYTETTQLMEKESGALSRIERELEALNLKVAGDEAKSGLIDGWLKDKKELKKKVGVLEMWEEWDTGKLELERALEIVKLREGIEQCSKMIEVRKKQLELRERMRLLEEGLMVLEDYDTWLGSVVELQGLKNEKVSLGARIGMMKDMVERLERTNDEIRGMMNVCETWTRMGDTLKAILSVFGRFKDWVLSERIIPTIVEGVNMLMEVMCRNHRVIEVECAFDNAAPQWFMKDGVNKVPLVKASGFQRFALSLGMRIVLGRLGVAGIKNKQLFIDEGFTACDGDNLSNIPDVLEELLGMYDSLVIVSHLEKLQEGIRSRIDIVRDGDVSWIGYGEREEELETKKKVGRPKKAVESQSL